MSHNLGREQHIAFFDLGHATCRLLILSPDLSEVRAFSAPMRGLLKGKVVDTKEFAATIGGLSNHAGLSNFSYRAIVNVPAIHTRCVVQTLRHRANGIYRSTDYNSIVEAAVDFACGELDEVIDVFPLSIKLDEKNIDPFAFGEPGREVGAQLMLATHPKLILADILAGMNAGNVEVAEFRSNGFGLARALKILRPNAENAVLLDVGFSSTSGALVVGGVIHKIFTIAAGSNHMTRDIMAGLHCSHLDAEELKRTQGLPAEVNSDGEQDTNLTSFENGAKSTNIISRFLRPRVVEILTLASKHFAMYARSFDGGLLFCGNGAALPGLSHVTRKSLRVSTPYICQLNNMNVEAYLGLKVNQASINLDSGWLSILSQARAYAGETGSRRAEYDSKPMSKLRPLWTWLSELSR